PPPSSDCADRRRSAATVSSCARSGRRGAGGTRAPRNDPSRHRVSREEEKQGRIAERPHRLLARKPADRPEAAERKDGAGDQILEGVLRYTRQRRSECNAREND